MKDTLAELSVRDALRGRKISWGGLEKESSAGEVEGADSEGSGIASGIDGFGNLLVETAHGTVSLNAGEVHLDAGG